MIIIMTIYVTIVCTVSVAIDMLLYSTYLVNVYIIAELADLL